MGGNNKKSTDNSANNSQVNKKHSLKVRSVATKKKTPKRIKQDKGTLGKEKSTPTFVEKQSEPQTPKETKAVEMPPIPRGRVIKVRDEKQKRIIMYFGVSFFMVLISIFWLYNTGIEIKKRNLSSSFSDLNSNWSELSEELGKQMGEMKEGLDEIRQFASSSTELETDMTGTEKFASNTEVVSRLRESLEKEANESTQIVPPLDLTGEEGAELKLFIERLQMGDDRKEVIETLGEPALTEELFDSRDTQISTIDTYNIKVSDNDRTLETELYITIEYTLEGKIKDVVKNY